MGEKRGERGKGRGIVCDAEVAKRGKIGGKLLLKFFAEREGNEGEGEGGDRLVERFTKLEVGEERGKGKGKRLVEKWAKIEVGERWREIGKLIERSLK